MAQAKITGNQRKALNIGQRLLSGARNFGDGIKNSVDTSKQVINQSARKIKADQKRITAENRKQKRFQDAVNEEVERRRKGMGKGGYALADTSKNLVKKVLIDPMAAFWNIVGAWVIKNLPIIVAEIRKFIKKVRIAMAAINNAFRAVGGIFSGWLAYGKAWVRNMVTFDWNDSQGRLRDAQQEIDDAQGELGASFDTLYNVWGKEEDELDAMLTWLNDGKTIQQTVDAITSGTALPQTPMVGPGSDSAGGGGGSGDNGYRGTANNYGMSQDAVTDTKWKPILNLIASVESIDGSYSSSYSPSGSRVIAGLENMTIEEAVEAAGGTDSNGRHYAIGRYQFTTLTSGQAALAGLKNTDKFSPENQDKMAIALIEKKKGINFDMLRESPQKAQMLLAQEWAGLPKDQTNRSYYGGDGVNAAHTDTNAVRGAFSDTLSGGMESSPSGSISSSGATTNADTLQRGDQVSGYGVSSAFGMRNHPVYGGSRNHGGLDIATPQGTYLAVSVDVVVLFSGSAGGYGYVIDAWAPSLGVQFRFAHMSVLMCNPGQRVRAGAALGRTGGRPGSRGAGTSTGPHVHYEISTQKGSANYGGSQDPTMLAKYAKYIILSNREPQPERLTARNMSTTARATANDLNSAVASNRTNGRQQNNHTVVISQTTVMST